MNFIKYRYDAWFPVFFFFLSLRGHFQIEKVKSVWERGKKSFYD